MDGELEDEHDNQKGRHFDEGSTSDLYAFEVEKSLFRRAAHEV